MPLTTGKPYLVLRTGMKGGKQVALVMDGDCADGITQNKPRTSLRTGTKGGKQVQLVADQKLDEDSKLIIGKPYLALRTGMKDGKQVVLVAGKVCGGDTGPFYCGCAICCTLDATVWVPNTAWPFATTSYADPVDVTLTCNRSFTRWNGKKICEAPDADPENPDDYQVVDAGETTYSGGSGTLTSPARDWVSTVWVSDSFEAGQTGLLDTWRLVYVHVQTTITEEGELQGSTSCGQVSILQKLVDGHWCHWGAGYGTHPGAIIPAGTNIDDFLAAWCTTDVGVGTCPEGWTGPYGIIEQCRGLCGSAGAVGIPTWDADLDDDDIMDCPIVAEWEMPKQGDGTWVCCKVQLFDLCGEE